MEKREEKLEKRKQEEILAMLKEIRPEFDFATSDNFIEDGLLDSFDIITLISMLEETYHKKIDGLDTVPENFFSIEEMIRVVEKSEGRN